tara:strand:+ start:1088 stop:1576 length:489 start_codon:yes stop_codon:yes gene_type:complete
MIDMVEVKFNDADIDFCRNLGDRRSGSMGHRDTVNSYTMTHKSRHRHFLGVVGELAYSKFSGLEVDSITIGRGDDGTDFNNGINVKCSDSRNKPNLIFPVVQYQRKYSEYYVLVWYKEKIPYLLGWTTRNEIDLKHKIVDFGYGETVLFSNSLLNTMDSIPI